MKTNEAGNPIVEICGETIVLDRLTLVDGAPDQQPREARCAVSICYLALAADVWISPCNMIPLYVERTPGNFDRWQGPTGRYAGEYGYPIYQKAEPDNIRDVGRAESAAPIANQT